MVSKALTTGKNANPTSPYAAKGKRGTSVEEALANLSADKQSKLSVKQQKNVAKFGKEFAKIKKQVGASKRDDFRSDLTTKAMLRAMMSMLLEMIPVAQEKYLETRSEPGAYALNALLTQLLTLSGEIRGLESLEEQAEYIVRQIITPVLMQFNQNNLVLSTGLKAEIDSTVKDQAARAKLHKSVNKMLLGQASYMQEHQKALSDRITSYLLGE